MNIKKSSKVHFIVRLVMVSVLFVSFFSVASYEANADWCPDFICGRDDDCDNVGENCCSGSRCGGGLRCVDGKCARSSPPPPCPTQVQGCYKKDNGKVDADTLKPREFDFYRVQNKCIESGNCNCPTSPPSTKTPDEVTDPDTRQEACDCIKKSEYSSNSGAECCGNEAEDCGRKSGNVICRMDISINDGSRWVSASSNRGDTTDVPCSGDTYLSTGTEWIKCDGVFQLPSPIPNELAAPGSPRIVKVNNHQYLCRGFGPKSVVECCGPSGQCQSKDGSVERLTTGLWVNPSAFTSRPRPPTLTLDSYEGVLSPAQTSTSANCGNGNIDANEDCDGANKGGKECRDISGFSGGTLACYPSTAGNNACKFDTRGCTGTPPGCQQGQIMCKINNVDRCWTPGCTIDNDCSPNWLCIRPGTCDAECINTNTDPFGAVVADITGMQAAAQTGTVRGYVWNDENQNGIFDSGESGIGRVNVRIVRNPNENEVVRFVNTNGDGSYRFDNVPASNDYRIKIEIPSGYRDRGTPSPSSCSPEDRCSKGDISRPFSLGSGQVFIYSLGITSSNTPQPTTPQPTTSQARDPCASSLGTSPIGSCDAPRGDINYEADVRSAISSYISNNGQIANRRNDDFDAVKTYLDGVAAVLRSRGFTAGRAKNCADNEAADAIIVGRRTSNPGSGQTLPGSAVVAIDQITGQVISITGMQTAGGLTSSSDPVIVRLGQTGSNPQGISSSENFVVALISGGNPLTYRITSTVDSSIADVGLSNTPTTSGLDRLTLTPKSVGEITVRVEDGDGKYVEILIKVLPAEPSADSPKGSFDVADCNSLAGWTCDQSSYGTALQIKLRVYDENMMLTNINIPALAADNQRSDVASVCGGTSNHGFSFSTPAELKTGRTYLIYANANDIPTGRETRIGTKSFGPCSAPTPPNLCGNGNIIDPPNEDCDGTNLNSKTCTNIPGGFTGGTPACYPSTAGNNACKFDTRGCTGTQTAQTGTIQGRVWNDANQNGIFETSSESGIGTVNVRIIDTTNNNEVRRTNTNGDGIYRLDSVSLNPSYRITIQIPSGYQRTRPTTSCSAGAICSIGDESRRFNEPPFSNAPSGQPIIYNLGLFSPSSTTSTTTPQPTTTSTSTQNDQYAEYYGIIINVGSGRTLRDTANIGYIEKASWSRMLPQSYTSYGNNMIYYCRADGTFAINLDAPGLNQQGNAAPADRNREVCTTAGFAWTGTKCCGEYGVCEYHNDPGQPNPNSCWNRTSRQSISLFESNAVILYEGNFHGCAIDKTNYFPQNNILLKLFDKGTNNQLITNHDYCFNDPQKNYFCSYNETWGQTEGKDRTRLSRAPQQNPRQAAECCAATECWDGTVCIANQRNNPLAQPIGDNFRCIDGEWKRAILRCAPEGEPCAYCNEESQCLLNPSAQTNQCVNNEYYSADNYCDNGIWATRTKILALKLLAMRTSSDDFTLFCDTKENTLNNLAYITESGELASSIIGNLNANNFCILKSGNRVVVGTSLNSDISQIRGGFNIFGVTSCPNAGDENRYYSCDASNKVWYNKKLKSIIYSTSQISVPSAQESSSSLSDAIRSIIGRIRALISPPPFDESYVNSIRRFDKLFLAKKDSRTIRGALDGTVFKNAVVEYGNFGTNICSYTDSFNRAGRNSLSGISCRKEGDNYYVLVQGSQFASLDPEQIWPDLTAKLRLR